MSMDILIIDDEADIRMLVSGILEDEGYAPREAHDADSALAAMKERRPHLVILDVWLEGSRLDGLGILREIRHRDPDLPVVMISGHGTIETAVAALKEGAYDFIEKPFKMQRLLLVVERALEATSLRMENRSLRAVAGTATDLIGSSVAIQQIRQVIERVAPTGSRVLVTGPAGSGKEVAARQIHLQSKRANGPFVVVNCAAMHPDRMERELFGLEPGHVAPDAPGQPGVFERAHGGTLLLDEVADMPMETQGKIVRVLQDQTFERLGGRGRVKVDVRVISTTNKDLAQAISEGCFREDLYYRLAVVPISMPPLHDRREDIASLAEVFLRAAAAASGTTPRTLGEDALAALRAYEWPGNIRQLRNAMDWATIMAPHDQKVVIAADMLPPEIGATAPVSLHSQYSAEIMGLPLRDARELFERDYLSSQLSRFGGNISKTAG
ncbi:MAG: sigma-54-dependent Fis family transcriptional regulator, partial [Rhodospirillaceae bacterium]|nr:sigma-54-dependent Fis family transcriptional regulator [Rhodospirillaceae bacterium]